MPALYLGDHPRLTFPLGPFCFPPNAPVLSAQFFPDVGPEIVLVNEEWESVFTLTEPWDFEQTYSSTSYTEEWDRSTLARFDSFIVSVVDTSNLVISGAEFGADNEFSGYLEMGVITQHWFPSSNIINPTNAVDNQNTAYLNF